MLPILPEYFRWFQWNNDTIFYFQMTLLILCCNIKLFFSKNSRRLYVWLLPLPFMWEAPIPLCVVAPTSLYMGGSHLPICGLLPLLNMCVPSAFCQCAHVADVYFDAIFSSKFVAVLMVAGVVFVIFLGLLIYWLCNGCPVHNPLKQQNESSKCKS